MNQNFYEPNMCSNSFSSDFDQFQPPQCPVIHQPPQEMSIQEMEDLKQQYLDEMKQQLANLITYPSKRFNSFCYDDDNDEDYTVVITPDFLITDSLIMENEHLDTILETKSNEFLKSSVENLVPIPSESEDFFNIESECDMPDYDDSQTIKFSTFPILSSTILPLVMTSQVMRSEFNPFHNEDLDSTPKNDHFDIKSYLLESLLNRDESIPSSIDSDDLDSEGDNLFLERLLHDDPIPFSDTLDFSNVVRVFLPFFTYPVTSSILLSSGSEDAIFNLGISNYHFSSLEPGVSHRSGTFMKFNVYPNHLNESPMEILSSTCSSIDQ
uniref:Uncharacterized protein n=1 Tax=Tanacetum cinerariifolium TaxID=118510 RepID=A0A699IUM2_TANCI|nr:hypothetical protein [Tanacetum cinerariifolium]